jgi:hypothetical protein
VEVRPSTPEKREQAPNRTGKTPRYPSAGGRPREAFGVLRLAVALEVEVRPSTPEKREQAPALHTLREIRAPIFMWLPRSSTHDFVSKIG